MLEEWIVEAQQLSGWRIMPPGNSGIPLSPRYRGAFDAGEQAPARIQLGSDLPAGFRGSAPEGGASVRFRAPSKLLGPRRDFGVSVEVDPEIWTPYATRKGWFFFSAGHVLLGLWTSLPATWLAAGPDGTPLPPPWRELWTFGTDHTWTFRLSCMDSGGAFQDIESFVVHCLSSPPSIPPSRWRDLKETSCFDSGSMES